MSNNREQQKALLELRAAVTQRNTAKRVYREAIARCVAAGVSNTRMAAEVGVSETAIRMYRHRNLTGK